MRRRAGDRGFTRISWDDAYASIAARWDGDRTAIFLTSRGVTNETYYVCGKAARAMGVASVDSAARVCHAPSTVALKDAIGAAATTCSFVDVLESDLIVLIGANPATNQPVFMRESPASIGSQYSAITNAYRIARPPRRTTNGAPGVR